MRSTLIYRHTCVIYPFVKIYANEMSVDAIHSTKYYTKYINSLS